MLVYDPLKSHRRSRIPARQMDIYIYIYFHQLDSLFREHGCQPLEVPDENFTEIYREMIYNKNENKHMDL